MQKQKDNSESFESLFSELESVVAKLEAGDLSLDESLALFQRGMELAKKCGEMLEKAELRIKQLVPQANGELGVEDFNEK
ncbi:MAG: exodeoxyribonuclease VII small subunit [Chloroflexi bacterium]|nr:exodeoxyribonuclease VII small subunit [Chloroflexota bacterium]